MREALVITGLPASGKSSVGRALASQLAVAVLDKDDFLEALFEERGIGDLAWRQSLSRESDVLFADAARAHSSAVLISHWRPPGDETSSGTPTIWLSESFARVVEVCCECPSDIAVSRFASRSRHAGHCDVDRDWEELTAWMRSYARHLPLGLGPLISVDTVRQPDAHEIADAVRQLRASP